MEFIYNGQPSRVIFGAGARSCVAKELDRLGIGRAIVISTPGHAALAEEFAGLIGSRAAVLHPHAAQHTPIEVTETALQAAQSAQADGCLAVGGGSAIGLSKAIALRTDLPQLVVPTTYAGSEMTPILGETENGRKTTRTSASVLPDTVVYDPELTLTLPASVAGPSGMNAIAHAVEALYARECNPITSLMAEESIRALSRSLPRIVAGDADISTFSGALYGAWLAGSCLGAVGMAIHHKICHTLGGAFDLPHADVHALMIPYSAAYNREAVPEAMSRIAAALGTTDAAGGLYDLMLKVACKKSLADLAVTENQLDIAADMAVQVPYWNPRPVTREEVRHMLQAAYRGTRP